MLHVKNLPAAERGPRIVAGVAAILGGVACFGSAPMGRALGLMGAMAATSGVIGFCPACALAARRLSK